MQKHALAVLLAGLLHSGSVFSQTTPAQPKLIVGIVIDQMRYDYLYRYQSKYSEGGFKRLLREGFSCENTHYNYAPTYTGPGHAAIYTGATPAVNGIIANEWYDRAWGRHRYVTTDTTVQAVGTESERSGRHSPRVLLSTTITDELRLFSNFRSKVVGVCLKDRGSILPAGHIPDACYWYDDKGGNWITSSYYADSLPQWVQDFNARRLPDLYLSQPWKKALDKPYDESFAGWDNYDDGKYLEFPGNMPHDVPTLKQRFGYTVLRFVPAGNTFTVDFALEVIDKMQLGQDAYPDMLCLSFSSPDYIGHQFGVHAEETEDMYLRLDGQVARLLRELDEKFGKNNVLVFLTADHGAAETPPHLVDLQIPAGVFPESKLIFRLNKVIADAFGKPGEFIHEINNQQIWFNYQALAAAGIDRVAASKAIIAYMCKQPGVYDAFTMAELMALPDDYPFISELRRGLHPRRSGDLYYLLDPAWHADDASYSEGGTTHGSVYAYDTHVPLLWYGWRVAAGVSFAPVNITDIAPTLAAMLRIMEPNGNTGKVIEAVVR